jgi:hypothetical protein
MDLDLVRIQANLRQQEKVADARTRRRGGTSEKRQSYSHNILIHLHIYRALIYLSRDLHNTPRLVQAGGRGADEGLRVDSESVWPVVEH